MQFSGSVAPVVRRGEWRLGLRRLGAFAAGILLAACAAPAPPLPVAQRLTELRPDTIADRPEHRPVLAIALGGGGLRGYAHIGVIQALEEAGIKPDMVVGTSIGAIVGAAYASGASAAQLWEKASTARLLSLADVTLAGPGFVRGEALARWTNELVGQRTIERFPRRFAAVASDLERSEPVVITRGDAGQAARASAAIPGVFLPVRYADGELVDGGVTSLVPVRAARALGADIVIGVDIYCRGTRYQPHSVLATWLRVSQTQSCLLASDELATADVVVAPAVVPAAIDDAAGREAARAIGHAAAVAALPAIRALLQRNGAGDAPLRGGASSGTAAPTR